MHKFAVILLAAALGACATTGASDQEKLASYVANAGEPVRYILYRTPISWETVDSRHLLLTMRPTESWLLRLSGPCLDWSGAVPTIVFDNPDRRLTAGLDTISFNSPHGPSAPVRCRIDEIRPVDVAAARAWREAAGD